MQVSIIVAINKLLKLEVPSTQYLQLKWECYF